MGTLSGMFQIAVFNFAKSVKAFTQQEAIDALGLTKNQFTIAIVPIKKAGYVKCSNGRFIWNSAELIQKNPLTDREKIWKAVKINPRFTVQEIARQSSVADSYVLREINKYVRDGFVERHGMTKSIDDKPVKVWRLTLKGRNKCIFPGHDLYMPDTLVDLTVQLNFIVCRGLLKEREDDRLTALSLCSKIKKELIKSGGDNEKQNQS